MDLQEKHYLCETNQAFCNICDKILCLSMSCAWLRKFQKRLKKAVQDHKRKLLNVKATECKHLTFSFRLRSIVRIRLVPFKMNSR